MPWLTPLILGLVAVASFGLVSFLLQHKSSSTNHDAMAPATIAANPSSASSSSLASASSPATVSGSPPSTTEGFPAEASTQCTAESSSGDYELIDNAQREEVRMKEGARTSCAFLGATRNEVLAKLVADPKATSFTVKPYSQATQKIISLDCAVSHGFTYCEGGASAKMWIRNP